MGTTATVLVGLVILVGIIGAVVQVYPSGPFVGGAILVWAIAWNTPAAYGKLLQAEVDKWAQVVKTSGAKID